MEHKIITFSCGEPFAEWLNECCSLLDASKSKVIRAAIVLSMSYLLNDPSSIFILDTQAREINNKKLITERVL